MIADAVVFVISPDSVASEICQWEVARTLELGKALVPLRCRPVADGAVPARPTERRSIMAAAGDGARLCDAQSRSASAPSLRE